MNPLIAEQVSKVPLFEGADHKVLTDFLSSFKVIEYKAGAYLCQEGEYDENCSIILSGSANVELPQKGAIRMKKIPLGVGELFGEIAVLSGNPRTADIVAAQPITVLNISKNDLFNLVDKFPTIKEKLDALYRKRALSSHLLTIPIFSGIDSDALKMLSTKVTLHSYAGGDKIFGQGDGADAFYLIRYGFVKVAEVTPEGKERVLAYLKDGHYFGEMALLDEGERRMASITAINRAELIKISRNDFQIMIKAYPSIKNNLEKVIEKRKERNIQISKDALLEKTLSSAIESGVIQTKAILIMDQTKCVHCDNCVKACADLHENNSRLVRKGVKFNNFLLIPTSCRHCEDPSCMSRCPTGAIKRGHDGEIYHEDFCIGCGSCAKRCPFDNISIVNLGDDGKTDKTGFFANIFSRNKENETAPKGNGRFLFPGDRDMVQKDSSSKLPGDRDMVGQSQLDDGAKGKKKKVRRRKAVKCDMCREYSFMGCVYNCPRGAARRVNPADFFSDIASVG